ncbi:hypothetical protein TREMEDRAFT_66037 [Tremella mesenterica DSM 1558]|uniref:uncharacterized protein n=1 Tax=Tremella mesenterica (strain ATCC 24925 / CBS 8224 / DSM 1558 / NBRC 9311 / NRRL Y-6157 / RJB 2259-6 / UBC 559-6) TaxID=578456 RepID=UPI00032CB888|nr:uncharacterized protein TREMEDRAFT_66037 [Tremella mesenterica DSM 1558]EIW65948.1 hypothetical protein TREMEDRAFT_66037 [Tremella mesenterica DSM 1558]
MLVTQRPPLSHSHSHSPLSLPRPTPPYSHHRTSSLRDPLPGATPPISEDEEYMRSGGRGDVSKSGFNSDSRGDHSTNGSGKDGRGDMSSDVGKIKLEYVDGEKGEAISEGRKRGQDDEEDYEDEEDDGEGEGDSSVRSRRKRTTDLRDDNDG